MSLHGWIADQRANMSVLFALAFSLSTIVSAIVVDAGALYHARRHLQAGVDLAAIAAAGDPSQARARAETALIGAGLGTALQRGTLNVVVGHYAADPSIAPEHRFVPERTPLNAARVEMHTPGTLYFAAGMSEAPVLSAQGLARVTPEVSFSLGSRLASLDGGIANAVLGTLLGTTLSLSVLDYNRLAAARVDVFAFLDALAMDLDIDALSYDDILAAQAGSGKIAGALARVVNGSEKALLHTISLAGPGNPVRLGKLFDLGRLGRLHLEEAPPGVVGELSVLDILSAAAALANGTRQAHLSLGNSAPGIAAFEIDLALGEPPQSGGWFAMGPGGTMVRTAQVRLRLALRLLAGSVVSNGVINLPLWLDVAPAQARVAGATCPSATQPLGTAAIAVLPGVLTLAIGALPDATMLDFGAPPPLVPVKLIDGIVVNVTGSARIALAQTTPIVLEFSSAEIAAGALKTARSQTLAASLTGSLLNELKLKVTIDLLNILSIGLNAEGIAKAVGTLLAPLAAPIDKVVSNLLHALGIGLGEADIRVYGVSCTDVALVG